MEMVLLKCFSSLRFSALVSHKSHVFTHVNIKCFIGFDQRFLVHIVEQGKSRFLIEWFTNQMSYSVPQIVTEIEAHLSGNLNDTDPNFYDNIISDSGNIFSLQSIISSLEIPLNIKFSASSILLTLVTRFYKIFDTDTADNFTNWCISAVPVSIIGLLNWELYIKELAMIYATVVVHRTEIDIIEYSFLDQIAPLFEQSPQHAIIGLYFTGAVVEAFLTFENIKVPKSFKSTTYILIVEQTISKLYSYRAVKDTEVEYAALNTIYQCLQGTQNVYNQDFDEVYAFTVEVQFGAAPHFIDFQFFQVLVSCYQELDTDKRNIVLEIFFRIISIRAIYFHDFDFKNDDVFLKRLYIHMAIFITQILDINQESYDSAYLNLISQIAYKFRIILQNHIELVSTHQSFSELISKFYDFTMKILDLDILMNQPQNVLYTMNFWALFYRDYLNLKKDTIRKLVHEKIIDILYSYSQLISDAFSRFPEETSDLFLDESENCIPPLLVISNFAHIDYETVANHFLDQFIEQRDIYFRNKSLMNENVLSIQFQIVTLLLKIEPSSSKTELYYSIQVEIFYNIWILLNETEDNIIEYKNSHENLPKQLEKSVLMFLSAFESTIFLKNTVISISIMNLMSDKIPGCSFEFFYLFVFHRLLLTLNTFGDSPILVKIAIHVLGNFCIRNCYSQIIKKDERIKEIIFPEFVFCNDLAQQENHENLLKISYHMIYEPCFKKEICDLYSKLGEEFINQMKLYDEKGFLTLLLKLTSLLDSITRHEDYQSFFNWFVPQYLDQLEIRTSGILNNPKITPPFLRFWCSFVHNISSRIVFDEFSPNGILLFKHACQTMTIFLNIMKSNASIKTFEDFSESFEQLLILLNESISAEYVMFHAFFIYNDPVFNDIIQLFFGTINKIDIQVLFLYPTVAYSLISLVRALIKERFNELFHIPDRLNIFELILIILYTSIKATHLHDCTNLAISTIECLFSKIYQHKVSDLSISILHNNSEIISKISLNLWQMIPYSPSIADANLKILINNLDYFYTFANLIRSKIFDVDEKLDMLLADLESSLQTYIDIPDDRTKNQRSFAIQYDRYIQFISSLPNYIKLDLET